MQENSSENHAQESAKLHGQGSGSQTGQDVHRRPEAELDAAAVQHPEHALPSTSLGNLPEIMQKACAAAGWSSLTPVQSLALPYMLAGRDIMVQSRTGSGKTGCYLLPMLEIVDHAESGPQALVLVPTRELALQVQREAAVILGVNGIKTCAVYGGTGYKRQLDALRDGTQVIIGTPGRVLDHILRHTLHLDKLRFLVFDEADRMLSIGFYPDMVVIARHLPAQRHTAMFSATYPAHVLRLADEFMTSPEMLSLSCKEVHVAEVEHLFCEVKPMDRDRALVRLLETENPSSAIIFCNTKSDVHYLGGVLQGFGYRADELSADLPQRKREAVLGRIRNGDTRYLVATDVAARGIDIPELSHVFLYGPPEDRESYIHRAGRTGRAGAAGTVISLVDVMQKLDLERIARNYHINLREIAVPADEDVAATVCARLTTLLEGRLRSLTGLERMRAGRYLPLAQELLSADDGDDDAALAIVAMMLDDCHRQSLNENRYPMVIAEQGRRRPDPSGQSSRTERTEQGSGQRRGGRRRRSQKRD